MASKWICFFRDNHMKKAVIFVVGLLFIFIFNKGYVYAKDNTTEKPKVDMEKGIIKFITVDTKATTSIRWKTVGFTVRGKTCNTKGDSTYNGGNPIASKPYGILHLVKGVSEPIGEYVYTTFTLKEQDVKDALIDAGLENLTVGSTVYLNGIFQVTHDGKDYGKKKYTLQEIQNAESWRNPNDFVDRFDIPVKFDPAKEDIKLQYITESGQSLGGETELAKILPNEIYKLTSKNISKQKNNYYLKKIYTYNLTSGKKITESKSVNINSKNYDSLVEEIMNKDIKQVVGGTKVVAVMAQKPPKPVDEESTITIPVQIPYPYGVIAADERDNEEYDVLQGIPTTEKLYSNVFADNYLLGYTFTRKYGKRVYIVEASKTYHLKWQELDPKTNKTVTKEKDETVTKTVYVEREYSFWKVDNLEYYKINKATVSNYALPGGTVTLSPKGYSIPNLSYIHQDNDKEHMIEPVEDSTTTLTLVSASHSGENPPNEDFTEEVEGKIKEIKVRNDRLVFNGKVIMDNNYQEKETKKPEEIEESVETIEADVLYGSGLMIDRDKANGTYQSTGQVSYILVDSIGTTTLVHNPSFPITGLTGVTIHTPTVCDAYISNKASQNQMISPDLSLNPLVLDTDFNLLLPTVGEHLYIEGYGYRDYSNYIASRQVMFPFDVYQNGRYIRSGTWVDLYSDSTNFYLPIWVDEGKYTINLRSLSINAAANGGTARTERMANLSLENYTAIDSLYVEVSGRLYDFKLVDISDYPTWQNVFRKSNSLKTTGFFYSLGTKNQNGIETGRNSKYTLPLVNGSHPTYKNIGAVKTGYVTRFQLTTIGNMYGNQDYILITPKFYYVDKFGKNRQEVDLYYSETFKGKKQTLVKVGSDVDKLNIKAYRLGDPYFSVPENEIKIKSDVTGKSSKQVLGNKMNLFTFNRILIQENLRTYIGRNYTPTGTVPAGVDPGKVTKSMQKWYGEYYLPSDIHAVPKNYPVIEYARQNYGIDYKENFWLRKGYIIVNFEIETIKNGSKHLSYINKENELYGFCNMWKKEGYQYNKVDADGNNFTLIDGDYLLYYTDQSAGKDYISGGTH
ncbi:DUF5704 domain-containing protein [Lachnoclostridium phytofermentans]|uniref:DUF5704 domain-containing protein n=1 Tax=Lachnoclostridium phytofermentans TaxID=66219 RepID=UPI00068D95E1|nr:DUF5704 domain-containing protein [Lachnoclostridium phytofermentans]